MASQNIGRFAPSPTGLLHAGSLVAAMASYLRARQQQGLWLLRIDDIDPPREVKGASAAIVASLGAFGFAHDGPVYYQSTRLSRYRQVLDQLLRSGQAFLCGCSRRQLGNHPHRGICQQKQGFSNSRSARLLMPNAEITFNDLVLGPQRENPALSAGDTVLWRVENWPSYQLANVVDDMDFGVSEVVRGADLLDSTARQIALIKLLDAKIPNYAHVPLLLGADGQKLSKQNLAQPIDPGCSESAKIQLLNQTYQFLNHAPIAAASLSAWWNKAIADFALERVTNKAKLDDLH